MYFKKKHNYNIPGRLYNLDETDLSVVQSKVPHAIRLREKEQIWSLISAEKGWLHTIILCISTGGDFVPPLEIFSGKNIIKTA